MDTTTLSSAYRNTDRIYLLIRHFQCLVDRIGIDRVAMHEHRKQSADKTPSMARGKSRWPSVGRAKKSIPLRPAYVRARTPAPAPPQ